MKKYYGWDCPGCGLTRSFISLSRGELVRAWQYNSGGPLLFLLIAIQIPYRTWRYFSLKKGNPEIPRQGWHWWPMGLALAWLIAQWLIRLAAGNL